MKCPGCGGSVYYDPKSGKMKCFYCSEEMNMDVFSKQEEASEENPGVSKWAKMQQELDAVSQEEKMIEAEMRDEYIDLHLYRCTN